MADAQLERFQFLTAKAICGRCAVQATCLEEAILLPGSDGAVRGGESGRSIKHLRQRHRAGDGSAHDLATGAINRQTPLSGAGGFPDLRAGRFTDNEALPIRSAGNAVVNSTVAFAQPQADN